MVSYKVIMFFGSGKIEMIFLKFWEILYLGIWDLREFKVVCGDIINFQSYFRGGRELLEEFRGFLFVKDIFFIKKNEIFFVILGDSF